MPQKLLEYIEKTTAAQCQYSVIWLHGLGASGNDFEPIVPELGLLEQPGVRFLFPHAPVRPITINGNAPMRGWYDIESLDLTSRKQDSAGIHESAAQISELIEHEISRGIPASRIILAGFSQGGAIALYEGLTGKHTLGGILALSTYMPIQDEALTDIPDSHKSVPIFMAHGTQDNVIQITHAEQSRQALAQHNVNVEWHSYPIAHSVSGDEIRDISVWLKRQLTV